MPYATVNDLTMYYEEHGTPDGPPLVLLHNFTGSGAAAWAAQLPVFGAHYHLVVPDWRGHGRTNNPGGLAAMNHRQFAHDIATLGRALGLERACFCGTSSGAMLLLTLALEAPGLVQALVLCGCTFYQPDEARVWLRAQTPETVVAPERRPAMQARHTALGPDHWRTVVASWIAVADHANAADFPAPEQLRRIDAPTLLIHGDRDRFFPVAVPVELYGLLPDAELCVLPQTGHGVQGERPEWFNAIVLDFLARRAA
jgi:pimeloyl-ACP methyl ester carboxylesterase